MSTPTKEAIKHLIIVFAYSGISAILPVLLAWLQNDPRWVILIPIINAVWYAITRYLKEKKLVEQGRQG
jgi:ABC-type nitrate/sulfonate/bicarbonate transport system permease component